MAGGGVPNNRKKSQRRQPAGVNALRVLEMLVDYPEGVGTTDLAGSLGMDTAQAHRLLNGLRSADYVAHTETSPRRYVITSKVLRLAARLLDQTDLLRVSRPTMRRMRDLTGETVNLAVLAEGEPVAVAREISRHPVSVFTRIGEVWPLNETAMGWAAQAFRNDGSSPDSLAERLAEIRRCGFAVDLEEYVQGVTGLAAPIFDYRGEVVGAVGVAGPADRMPTGDDEIARMGKLVVEAADEISTALGSIAGHNPSSR